MFINDRLLKNIERIRQFEERFLDFGMRMLSAYGGKLYPLDLLALGAVKRSMSLCHGFLQLIEDYNFTCAGALLRMQLDNALRFYAAFLVSDPHEFASHVIKGASIRKYRDRSGILLTDKHLVEELAKEYSWVKKVYDETSKLIHLTEKHIFITLRPDEEKERSVKIEFGALDKHIPEEAYLESTEAFIAATEVLFIYLEGWVFTKDKPELVAELKRRLSMKRDA
jgi:hypothetical protein